MAKKTTGRRARRKAAARKTKARPKKAARRPRTKTKAKAKPRPRTKTRPKTRAKGKAKAKPKPRTKPRTRPGRSARRKSAGSVRKSTHARRAPAPRRRRGQADFDVVSPIDTRGLGPEAGGQAGDTEGLSRAELADSESVEELLEEGQAFEAGVVSGVENAPDADEGEVETREVPEDDVPEEYRDRD